MQNHDEIFSRRSAGAAGIGLAACSGGAGRLWTPSETAGSVGGASSLGHPASKPFPFGTTFTFGEMEAMVKVPGANYHFDCGLGPDKQYMCTQLHVNRFGPTLSLYSSPYHCVEQKARTLVAQMHLPCSKLGWSGYADFYRVAGNLHAAVNMNDPRLNGRKGMLRFLYSWLHSVDGGNHFWMTSGPRQQTTCESWTDEKAGWLKAAAYHPPPTQRADFQFKGVDATLHQRLSSCGPQLRRIDAPNGCVRRHRADGRAIVALAGATVLTISAAQSVIKECHIR